MGEENARSFASAAVRPPLRMTFGLRGGAAAGSWELGGGSQVYDGELEALGVSRVHGDDGFASDLVPGFEEDLEGGEGDGVAGDDLLGERGEGGGFGGRDLDDPEKVFEVAGVFERHDAEGAGSAESPGGGGDGAGEAAALADGAGNGDGGDGGDRSLGDGAAVDDDDLVVDHGDLVLEGGVPGHGHAGVVGTGLAGFKGGVVGAHDSAEDGDFAGLRTFHFDEAFTALDDFPAGGEQDGGGAVGVGPGGGLAGGLRNWGGSGRAQQRWSLGGGRRCVLGRGLGGGLGSAVVRALAGGLDGLWGLRLGGGGEEERSGGEGGGREGGDAGEGPVTARG